jgi:hypothetical protein
MKTTFESHRPVRAVLALCLSFFASAPSLLAWGKQGHQIVATIAARGLSPAATAQVKALLDGKSLADVAPLPDDWRATQPETPGWHFVNIEISDTGYDPARDCPAQTSEVGRNCAVAAIDHFRVVLADKTATKAARARALTFVVHFLGDIHQPLHCADNHDRGGNDVAVDWFGLPNLDGFPVNLHAVWDEGIIEHTGMNVSDYATHLLKMTAPSDATTGTTVDWANQSFNLAKSHAYKIPAGKPPKLGQDYFDANLPTVNDQLLRGGLRLRGILESALGGAAAKPTGVAVAPNVAKKSNERSHTMSHEAERNKKTTVKFWEQVLNDQNFDLVPELLSPDYKFNGMATNAAQTIGWVKGMHQEMPDLHFTIETILAEDDKVALRWRLTATDPATKKKSYNLGTNIIVFKDGKAVTNDQGGGDKFVAIPEAPSAPAPK